MMKRGFLSTATAIFLASISSTFLTVDVDGFSVVPTSALSTRTASRNILTTTSLSALKHMIEIEDSNFRELFRGEEYVLVDCCAKWCGPCKLIEPTLEECAKKWKDKLVVGKYDVQSQNDQVKIELLLQGAMPSALPALILIHKNQVLTTWKGVISPEELDAMLEQHILHDNENDSLQEEVAMALSQEPQRKKSGLISFAATEDEYMLQQR